MPSSTKGCCIVNRLIQTDVSIKSSMILMGRKNLNIGGFKVDNFQQKYPFYFEIILCYKGQILSRGLTWDKSPLWKYADGPHWPLPPWSPGIQYYWHIYICSDWLPPSSGAGPCPRVRAPRRGSRWSWACPPARSSPPPRPRPGPRPRPAPGAGWGGGAADQQQPRNLPRSAPPPAPLQHI